MVTPKFSPILGFLRDLEVLPPAEPGNFQVFSLRFDPWHKRISHLATLEDSLAAGVLSIRELDLHRGAPSIWLMNDSGGRIFLPAGAKLPCAGGGRRLRVSLVLGALQTLKIQADLLEEEPPPAADACPFHPRFPRDASGAVFTRGGLVLGMEIFERRETFRRHFPAVLARWAARGGEASAGAPPLDETGVKRWLDSASLAKVEVHPSLGLGREVLLVDHDFRGRCLLLDEGLVHAEISGAPISLAAPEADRRGSEKVGPPVGDEVQGRRTLPFAGRGN